MEKVKSTGRENFTATVEAYTIDHIKTTTASNVYVTSTIKRDGERIGSASYNKNDDHFTLGIRSWAGVSEADRVKLVQTITENYNELFA